jgi:hypothetical protein
MSPATAKSVLVRGLGTHSTAGQIASEVCHGNPAPSNRGLSVSQRGFTGTQTQPLPRRAGTQTLPMPEPTAMGTALSGHPPPSCGHTLEFDGRIEPREVKCPSPIWCHHLVKTFWGWHDWQLPDGTVILTSRPAELIT